MNDRAGLEVIRPGDLVTIDSPNGPVALVIEHETRVFRHDGGIYTILVGDTTMKRIGGYRLYKKETQ